MCCQLSSLQIPKISVFSSSLYYTTLFKPKFYSTFLCFKLSSSNQPRFHLVSVLMAEVFLKDGENETKLSPMQNNKHPKDLLKRFLPQETTQLSTDQENKVHEKTVDINLGLSLSGIYSSQKNSYEKPILSRSSSIIGMLILKKDPGEFGSPLPKSFLSLARSCSVPTEAEQEQRKTTLMALAMRKIESTEEFIMRQRNRNVAITEGKKSPVTEPMLSSPSKVAAWAAASAARRPALCRDLVQIKRQASLSAPRKLEGQEDSAAEKGAICSQSLPSENNVESKVMLRTSAIGKSVNVRETKLENPSKKAKLLNNCFQDDGMDVLKQMPSVTTTGDGPNGRKIEGFLYKYRKGQVSIVCVCHGSFLSPAEFVRHAGGKEVANPTKHITICSSFSF